MEIFEFPVKMGLVNIWDNILKKYNRKILLEMFKVALRAFTTQKGTRKPWK